MNITNNYDWLLSQSKDEITSLNDISRWMTESLEAEEFFKYIAPHAKYYFSPLNNFFLFLLKDFSSLNHFQKVFVRDGLLGLKLFFLRNPTPKNLKTKLIVNRLFKRYIPESWQSNVILYSYRLDQMEMTTLRDNLIILCHPDSLHCPEQFVKNMLKDTKQYQKVYCLLTEPRTTDTDGFISSSVFNKIKEFTLHFKSDIIVSHIDKISNKDIAASDFLELNQNCFLFSDCYMRWHLLTNGSRPINSFLYNSESNSKFIANFRLSPYHSVDIFDPIDNFGFKPTINERLIFSDDLTEKNDDSPINLCSNGFKEYIYSLINNEKINH